MNLVIPPLFFYLVGAALTIGGAMRAATLGRRDPAGEINDDSPERAKARRRHGPSASSGWPWGSSHRLDGRRPSPAPLRALTARSETAAALDGPLLHGRRRRARGRAARGGGEGWSCWQGLGVERRHSEAAEP